MDIYEKDCLNFQSTQDSLLLLLLLLLLYKMVHRTYSIDINKSVQISTGIVLKNQKMLKLVPDHLKTKKMRNHAKITLSIKICS